MPATTAAGSRPGPRLRTAALGVLGAVGMLAVLCAHLLGTATPAAAHADLTDSNPVAGTVVDSAPDNVTLTFSESVRLGEDAVRVLDPDGERVDTGRVLDRGSNSTHRYEAPLRGQLTDGTYTVAWQAVSADSHPIAGAFTFSLGAPSETSVELPEQETGGGTVGTLYDVARYAAYGGFVLLAGGAAFVLACWPRGVSSNAVRGVITSGWLTVTAATMTLLLLRGPYVGSGRLADALDLAVLNEVVQAKTGAALVSRLLLLAVAGLFVAALFGTRREQNGPERRREVTAGLAMGGTVVAAALAATWAASEHASTGIQTAVAMPVDVLHLLAVAAWLGGLAALTAALCTGTASIPREAVARFSRIALGSVAVLAATGLYQSWRQVGSLSALTGTDYGKLLLLKTALVAVLVALGWFSRRWTNRLTDLVTKPAAPETTVPKPTVPAARAAQDAPDGEQVGEKSAGPAAETAAHDPARAAQLARQRQATAVAHRRRIRHADPQRAGLRRSLLAETAVAVAVLAVTTLLTGTQPARTAGTTPSASGPAESAPQPLPRALTLAFDTGGPGGKGVARLALTPGRTGNNVLDVQLTDADGTPLTVPEVKVSFTLQARDIGPLRVTPRDAGSGRWTKDDVSLPVAGQWEVALTVRSSDIDQITETRTFRIA